jgi:hypothetical protein
VFQPTGMVVEEYQNTLFPEVDVKYELYKIPDNQVQVRILG